MFRRTIFVIIGLIVVGGIAFKAKSLMQTRQEEIKKTPLPTKDKISVNLTKAKKQEIVKTEEYIAILEADKQISVSTKMAGYIKDILVDENQKVKKGQSLVLIDDSDINSNISILKTNLQQQKKDLALAKEIYQRNLKLYNIGGLAKEQLDTSKLILEGKKSAIISTKAKIRQLQEQKSYLNIKSSFDGIIDKIIAHRGDLAVMGKPILLMNNGEQKLIFSFTPSQNSDIRVGQSVFYKDSLIGTIKEIKTVAKMGLSQAEVKLNSTINLPNGSNLNILVEVDKKRGCVVPNNALIHKEYGTFIMRYTSSKFEPMKINVILDDKEKSIIEPCPKESIAIGSESKLSYLTIYDNIEVVKGDLNE